MTRRVEFKARPEIPHDVVESFAREWAEFRLGGLPSGFYEPYRDRAGKAARRCGVTFAEFWPLVHKRAYELIDGSA